MHSNDQFLEMGQGRNCELKTATQFKNYRETLKLPSSDIFFEVRTRIYFISKESRATITKSSHLIITNIQ